MNHDTVTQPVGHLAAASPIDLHWAQRKSGPNGPGVDGRVMTPDGKGLRTAQISPFSAPDSDWDGMVSVTHGSQPHRQHRIPFKPLAATDRASASRCASTISIGGRTLHTSEGT